MSELTPCNRCTLRWMEQRARARGVDVVVEVARPPLAMAGWTSARYSDETEPATYFLVLPDRCAC